MKTPILTILILVLPCLAGAQEIKVGSDRAAVIKKWGAPKSRMALGTEETLIYDKNVRVYLKNGKVTGFKNRNLMPSGASSNAPAVKANPVANVSKTPVTFDLIPPDLSNYQIPKPTIYSDPNYRVRGTAGGESDGKTIGIDGRPLADHHQYANDSAEFLKLIRMGVKLAMPSTDPSALTALYSIHRAKTLEARREKEAYYRSRYRMDPKQSGLYAFAGQVEGLQSAVYKYQEQKGHLNYEERLRVKDRIDLNKAPTPKGMERRKTMKESVWRMEQHRRILMSQYANIFNAARKTKATDDAEIAASERFAVVDTQDAQMFIYQKFERTPMLEGLAEAASGRTHERAKPVLLPKGAKVQIVASKTVLAPAFGGRPAMSLKVNRIKIKDPNVRQLNGAKLNMTFLGWVLAKDLKSVSK